MPVVELREAIPLGVAATAVSVVIAGCITTAVTCGVVSLF